jgi:hypothetical protein
MLMMTSPVPKKSTHVTAFRHGTGGKLSASPRLLSLRVKQTTAMNTFAIDSYDIALYIGMK